MYRSHDRPRRALAGFFLVLAVASVQGRYQDDKKEPKDFVKYKVTVAAVKDGPFITLRPNVRQKVYVTVDSPSDKADMLSVLLKAAGEVKASATVEVKEGKNEVRWTPAPAGKDAFDGPFEIVLADKDKKALPPRLAPGGKVAERIDPAPLLTMSPYEYLTIGDGDKAGPKKLSLKASASDKFVGPSARVVLDIPADRIKGDKKGTFKSFVGKGAPAELVAEPIEDTTGKELVDAYGLDVDGIKRGLLFRVTTVGGKSAVETDKAGQAALLLPRITRPTDKLAVDVLTSGNIYPDDRVVVSVLATPYDAAGDAADKYVPVATFVGPRKVQMRAGVDLDGGLYLEPVTAEHKMTLDLSGIFGRTKVRVGVYDRASFDAEGNLKADAKVRGDTVETTQVVHVSDTPPKVDELKALRRAGPKGKETEEESKEAVRGQTVILRAVVSSESSVTDVKFVIGKLPADGKLPPDAIPGRLLNEKTGWQIEYPVPADAKSPLEVTAVVTNVLGLSASAAVKVDLLDAVPESAAVSGKVFEMDVPLDNLPVILLDGQGTEVAAVRSAGGKFTIPNVPPGKYYLFARRDQTGGKAMMPITVSKPSRADLVAVDPKDIELILEVPPEVKPKEKKKEEKKDKEAKKGKISGEVVEGDRFQPGLTVQLIDATTGKVLKTATTDERGEFAFKDVEKGKYALAVVKSASRTKAVVTPFDLDAGQEKSVGEMKLFR
ncbi:MAG: hypothetical protein ACRC33_18690 [Gemmataceae bacterium]